MPNKLKKKSNILAQKVHDIYDHDFRKVICITTGLTALLCKISLQFCCEFIDNNRSNISFIKNVARWVKFPTSTLYIIHSAFILRDLVKDYKDPKGKKELAKILGKSASLTNSTIEALMILKVIHFLARGNADVISYVSLTSTILFLFISEPISYYYSWRKYLDNKDPEKSAECKKDLIISTLTLSLGLLNFILRRIETPTIPINLGNGIIYNFNLSVTVSIIYSAVFLVVQFDKLFNQPINDDPSTELDGANHIRHDYDGNGLPNGDVVGM
ncbi:hypothetical protein [Wolbachia endosymbiont of Drosophila pseudotakahashii]|uniref:hypothetical protein n=1 Tax=Wolbachia endosymbiont of Drosophila pseudotakahashii TaxID=375919 RepID=UPI00222F4341|nr:hypothetical protein [Wolbachia endosymbiont of Drosophila pseudotakahashii]MCX3065741.1 hypothetical protein [Wolbachia endosymbiont of Drosophila pseudotakahashii]UZE38660.1 hypothetical protein ONI09_00665 [Wolbachia endosymbiont of Drosophila pseudotakahashii]